MQYMLFSGVQQLVLLAGMIGSWAAQVPMVLLCTQLWRNDLYGLFTGVCLGYGILDCILAYVVFTTDWQQYADEAKLRSAGGKCDVSGGDVSGWEAVDGDVEMLEHGQEQGQGQGQDKEQTVTNVLHRLMEEFGSDEEEPVADDITGVVL